MDKAVKEQMSPPAHLVLLPDGFLKSSSATYSLGAHGNAHSTRYSGPPIATWKGLNFFLYDFAVDSLFPT